MDDLMRDEIEGMGVAALAVIIVVIVFVGAAAFGSWELWRYRDVFTTWWSR